MEVADEVVMAAVVCASGGGDGCGRRCGGPCGSNSWRGGGSVGASAIEGGRLVPTRPRTRER
eukprot:2559643-Pleurochrysis_carterae.AAC.2